MAGIREIKENKKNKIFFENAGFHGDKGYKILKNGTILEVKTSHGLVRYELNGTEIGNHLR